MAPSSPSITIRPRALAPVGSVRDFYELGVAFLKTTKGERLLGAAQGVADERGCSEVTAYKARQFARLYSRGDMEELVSLQLPDGRSLGIGHVYELVQVKSKADRKRLQERAAKRGWSSRELKRRRKQEFGYKTTTNLGRKPSLPANMKDAFLDISQRADRWLRWVEAFGPSPARSDPPPKFKLRDLPTSVQRKLIAATNAIKELSDALNRSKSR